MKTLWHAVNSKAENEISILTKYKDTAADTVTERQIKTTLFVCDAPSQLVLVSLSRAFSYSQLGSATKTELWQGQKKKDSHEEKWGIFNARAA